MLVDALEYFWNMCVEIYELDQARFPVIPELTWQAALKKSKVKLDLLVDFCMLLMLKKVLEVEYITPFINMQS